MPTTMLYKCPGPHQVQHGTCDYVIVDDEKIAETIAAGWHLTLPEAHAAHQSELDAAAAKAAVRAAEAPPTRAELEQKAAELGITFDGRTGDKRLAALIAEKLGG